MLKKIFYFLLYILLQITAHIIRLFPLTAARFFARLLGGFVFYFVPIRRNEVIQRLSQTFPQKSTKEIRKIAKDVYIQFTISMAELIFFPKLSLEDIKNMVKIHNEELLEKLVADNRGGIIVTGHFGNWELMGAVITQYRTLNAPAVRQHNIYVDRLLNRYRLDKKVKPIPLGPSIKNILKALKAGELVGILADQDARERGVFVDFLGRLSSTPQGPAVIALKMKVPMLTAFIVRNKNFFEMYLDEVEPPPVDLSEQEQIKIYTQRYTRKLEEFVLKYPDHWFWFHRRWKSTPPPGN